MTMLASNQTESLFQYFIFECKKLNDAILTLCSEHYITVYWFRLAHCDLRYWPWLHCQYKQKISWKAFDINSNCICSCALIIIKLQVCSYDMKYTNYARRTGRHNKCRNGYQVVHARTCITSRHITRTCPRPEGPVFRGLRLHPSGWRRFVILVLTRILRLSEILHA